MIQGYEIEEKKTDKISATFASSPAYITGNENSVSKKRNLLVEACAPPQKPAPYPIHFVIIGAILFTFMLSSYLPKLDFLFYLPIGAAIFYILNKIFWFFIGEGIRSKEIQYMEAFKKWENRWHCLKCGYAWIEE